MAAGEREIGGVRKLKRRRSSASDEKLLAMVRQGDEGAFEALYDRHARELLSFCRYLLGSLHDAEDAVQSTFAAAHRSLLADDRPIELRPWLFAIARNASLSILRRARRPAEVERLPMLSSDPFSLLEQREDLRELVGTLLELPERQRTSLILAELHGLRYSEIAEVLGVRSEQVKAYVFQARANLTAERQARALDCLTIRAQIATARGHGLLKADIRRHIRSCSACQEHAEMASPGRGVGVFAPLAGIVGLWHRLAGILRWRPWTGPGASQWTSSVASPAAELTGGGGVVFAAKLLAGIALLGAGAKLGASQLTAPSESRSAATSTQAIQADAAVIEPTGSTRHGSAIGSHQSAGVPSEIPRRLPGASPSRGVGSGAGPAGYGGAIPASPQIIQASRSPGEHGPEPVPAPARQGQGSRGRSEEAQGKSTPPVSTREASHGKSEEAHGKSEEAHGKSEEAHGKSEEAHGKSEEAHGKSEEAHGASESISGKSEAPPASHETHGKSEEPHGQGGTSSSHGVGESAHGTQHPAATETPAAPAPGPAAGRGL